MMRAIRRVRDCMVAVVLLPVQLLGVVFFVFLYLLTLGGDEDEED